MSGGYVAALALAGVLVWAAGAKVRRPAATAASLRGLRLPAPRVLTLVIPALEVGTAAALALAPRLGAFAAVGLLASFSGVLAVELRRGSGVGCGCFGGAHATEPVGPVHLVRNGMLVALALWALLAERPGPPTLPEVVLVTTAVASAWVFLALLRLRHAHGALFALHLPGGGRSRLGLSETATEVVE